MRYETRSKHMIVHQVDFLHCRGLEPNAKKRDSKRLCSSKHLLEELGHLALGNSILRGPWLRQLCSPCWPCWHIHSFSVLTDERDTLNILKIGTSQTCFCIYHIRFLWGENTKCYEWLLGINRISSAMEKSLYSWLVRGCGRGGHSHAVSGCCTATAACLWPCYFPGGLFCAFAATFGALLEVASQNSWRLSRDLERRKDFWFNTCHLGPD